MKVRLTNGNWDMSVGRFVRSTLVAFALFLVLGSTAWAGAQQTQTTVLHEDFEDDALGPLGAPWTISSAGGGSVSIVNTTDHGHVLRLQGSTVEGSFLIASRAFS